jgi:hypothetical protein
MNYTKTIFLTPLRYAGGNVLYLVVFLKVFLNIFFILIHIISSLLYYVVKKILQYGRIVKRMKKMKKETVTSKRDWVMKCIGYLLTSQGADPPPLPCKRKCWTNSVVPLVHSLPWGWHACVDLGRNNKNKFSQKEDPLFQIRDPPFGK